MKIFVYPQENGSVAVSSIIDDEMDCLKEISPDGIYINPIELNELDNYFFKAVELKDGKLDINIKKAQEITQERVRIERQKLLEKLDILYQRALESGKDLRDIEEEKQRLRDLPNDINNITHLKELKDFPVKTELEFKNLKHIGLSSEQYILHLQRENEQLHLNVNKLELEMATVLKALKKKYIL
jgi:hypothetical protein